MATTGTGASLLSELGVILADPSTDAEIAGAIIATVRSVINFVEAHKSGTMSANDAAAAILRTITADKTADTDADDAGEAALAAATAAKPTTPTP